jgi:small subunit ribosomal protein S21
MLIVELKEGDSIDKALKKLKRKYEKTGVAREVKARQFYVKP